jgi:hypothetical protein
MAAVQVLSLTLMWFEDQEPVNAFDQEGVLDLARQFAALRATAPTAASAR